MTKKFCSAINVNCDDFVMGQCNKRTCLFQLDLSTASQTDINHLKLIYLAKILLNLQDGLNRQKDLQNQNNEAPRRPVKLCAKPVICKHECAGFCKAPADNRCDYMHTVNLTNAEYAALVAKMRNKIRQI